MVSSDQVITQSMFKRLKKPNLFKPNKFKKLTVTINKWIIMLTIITTMITTIIITRILTSKMNNISTSSKINKTNKTLTNSSMTKMKIMGWSSNSKCSLHKNK